MKNAIVYTRLLYLRYVLFLFFFFVLEAVCAFCNSSTIVFCFLFNRVNVDELLVNIHFVGENNAPANSLGNKSSEPSKNIRAPNTPKCLRFLFALLRYEFRFEFPA